MGDFETTDNADPAGTFPHMPKPAAEAASASSAAECSEG